ncbi:hypothetical protein J6590_005216 [Homalodisca vitripennis]|nr:hypothetical protein J6590_005216 [Homalodisca vitripennis]
MHIPASDRQAVSGGYVGVVRLSSGIGRVPVCVDRLDQTVIVREQYLITQPLQHGVRVRYITVCLGTSGTCITASPDYELSGLKCTHTRLQYTAPYYTQSIETVV